MEEQNPDHYLAFISHRMEGRGSKSAERLAAFLNRFRTPQELLATEKFSHLPKQLANIYYSKDSGVPPLLFRQMPPKLRNSEFLIVVCTQDYAHPTGPYCYADIAVASFLGYPVSEEEKHGLSEKEMDELVAQEKAKENNERLNHIIPVIFRKRNEKPTDCLPPLLRRLGHIGQDTRSTSEREVFITVVSMLLGIRKNDLYDRWLIEHKRALFMDYISKGGGILFVGALAVWWYTGLPRQSYYTDFVERYNVPEGLNPITEEQRRHLNDYFCITKERFRTTRIDRIGAFQRTEYPRAHVIQPLFPRAYQLEYPHDHEVVSKHLYADSGGSIFLEKHFLGQRGKDVELYTIRADQGDDSPWTAFMGSYTSVTMYDNPWSSPRRVNIRIPRISRTFDAEGCVTEERYCNYNGRQSVENEMGVNGQRFERDGQGRIIRRTFLDATGHPMADMYGAVCCEYVYNEDGTLQSEAYFGEKHERVAHHHGAAIIRYRYDRYGNLTAEHYLSQPDEPITNDEGYAERRYEYDQQGRLISEAYFDIHGQPCYCNNEYAAKKYVYHTGENSYTEYFVDTSGQTLPDEMNVPRRTYIFDKEGLLRTIRYETDSGTLALFHSDIVTLRYTYDSRGYRKEICFFGADGKPCNHAKGHAKVVYTHDDRGNITSLCFFDAEGNPCMVRGRAKELREYDADGNLTCIRYFDTADKPCLVKGHAKSIYTYDDSGHVTSCRVFGTDDMPCLVNGIATVLITYDEYGHEASRCYLGTDGNPCLHENGVARTEFTNDKQGRILSQRFFGVDGQPCLHRMGCAEAEYTYDTSGHILSYQYKGIDGKPCLCKDGFARLEQTFDQYGENDSVSYFDAQGHPCPNEDGFTTIRHVFAGPGRRLSDSYYGPDLENGLPTSTVARIDDIFDEEGNLIAVRFYDKDDCPTLCKNGYHRLERTNDEKGRMIAERYFGMDDKPILHRNGYAVIERTYGRVDDIAQERYFGMDGQPCDGPPPPQGRNETEVGRDTPAPEKETAVLTPEGHRSSDSG